MAFRFFDPMTAPGPVRPACLPPSLLMLANLTRFSPAGPMQATRVRGPNCFLTAGFCLGRVQTGQVRGIQKVYAPIFDREQGRYLALFPRMTRASHPALFNSVARKLEERESPMKPVSGDLVTTANLLEVVSLLPTSGLVANISGLPGSRGSMRGGQCWWSR